MTQPNRNLFPMNHWDSHVEQALDDLAWGRQLEACHRRAVKDEVRESAAQGLPQLDPNGTGGTVYRPREDLR